MLTKCAAKLVPPLQHEKKIIYIYAAIILDHFIFIQCLHRLQMLL